MSEELLQRGLKNPPRFGRWDFYNIGSTTVKTLKEHGIIRNVNYGDEEKKKVDALLVQKKNVIAVIEYKKPSEFKTAEQKKKAITQELEVARKLNAHIFIATDTKETIWINVLTGNRIKDENSKELRINFDLKNEKLPDLYEKIIASINEKNDQIKPKELVNPTDLARSIWQDIWIASGESPTNSLYTFVELFIFKYLSDLGVLKGNFNFYQLYNSFKDNSVDEVLEIYAKSIRPQIKKLFPESSIDKTTVVNGSVFITHDGSADNRFSLLFKKVLTKFYDYGKLEYIDYDFKSKLFESFLKESISKQNLGQFFTPLNVVRAIVEMAKDDIKAGYKICDPACGVGKFLLEAVKKHSDFYEIKQEVLHPKVEIFGFDKGFEGKGEEQKTIIMAKANMLIYFSDLLKENPAITKEFAKLFNDSFKLKTNSILGTLADPVENEYDLILTNPPYVTTGVSALKEEIRKNGALSNYYKLLGAGAEGLFMEWIVKALKPNGKAFVVLPENFFFRPTDSNLRSFILEHCFIDGILSLPKKTFFSTVQQTSILCITKKNSIKEIQKQPVFTYLISEIGEGRDVNRFSIEQDDLKEAVELFRGFKGSPEYFIKNNTDERCKTIPIKWFVENISGWSIEKLWTKEEKINLGINETETLVNLTDYKASIQDALENIENLKNELDTLTELPKNINYISKTLDEIFEFESGNSVLTQLHINKNKGEYVVYSAKTKSEGVFGYINTYDFDTECIQITTNGVYAGTVFYRPQHRFSINGDARLLIKKHENLDYQYLLKELKEAFAEHSFNWENKPTVAKTKNIQIKIPVDKNGNFSIKIQKELASNFNKIEFIKRSIAAEFEKLNKLNIKQ